MLGVDALPKLQRRVIADPKPPSNTPGMAFGPKAEWMGTRIRQGSLFEKLSSQARNVSTFWREAISRRRPGILVAELKRRKQWKEASLGPD